jgi:hypothetical protein
MKTESSLPCSQEPSSRPYPEPEKSSPYKAIRPLYDTFLILSSHVRLGLPSGLFPSGFRIKIL